jgi:hypothetical protein
MELNIAVARNSSLPIQKLKKTSPKVIDLERALQKSRENNL